MTADRSAGAEEAMPAARTLRGRPLVSGTAAGRALVLSEPLSLWGGIDAPTGRIIDPRHPRAGAELRGRVLVMPSGRGSSSSSSVLAEAIRCGTAPAAIVLAEPDGILVLGAIVAGDLYGRTCPIVVLDGAGYEAIGDGERLVVTGGEIRIEP